MLGLLYNCASKNTFKNIFILMVGWTPLLLNFHCWCLKYFFLGCSVIQVSSFTTSIHYLNIQFGTIFYILSHMNSLVPEHPFEVGFFYWDLLLTKHFEIMNNLIYGHVSNCLFIPSGTPSTHCCSKNWDLFNPNSTYTYAQNCIPGGTLPHCGPKVSLLVFKNLFVAL